MRDPGIVIVSDLEVDEEGVGGSEIGPGIVDGRNRAESDVDAFSVGGLCAIDGARDLVVREPDVLVGMPGCALKGRSDRLGICDGAVVGVWTGVGGRTGATWGMSTVGVVMERLALLSDDRSVFVVVTGRDWVGACDVEGMGGVTGTGMNGVGSVAGPGVEVAVVP